VSSVQIHTHHQCLRGSVPQMTVQTAAEVSDSRSEPVANQMTRVSYSFRGLTLAHHNMRLCRPKHQRLPLRKRGARQRNHPRQRHSKL
jgi:hypothetical protein